jgi:hypothetical protein
MFDEFAPALPRRLSDRRTILWRDERNAANHAEFLDFARRSTERQVDRMLRIMPVFPDGPEIIFPTRNIWAPGRRLVFENELTFAAELQRLGGLDGFLSASGTEDKTDVGEPVEACPDINPICGPDVTKQMAHLVDDIVRVWADWSDDEKETNCDELFRIWPHKSNVLIMPGAYAWDIAELHHETFWLQLYRPPCLMGKDCESTVQIDSGCHDTGAANYLLYGVACRCCNVSVEKMLYYIWLHKGPLLTGQKGAANYPGSCAWALAGRKGWPNPAVTTPFGDKNCCMTKCPIPYGVRPQPGVKLKMQTGQPFRFHWGSHPGWK